MTYLFILAILFLQFFGGFPLESRCLAVTVEEWAMSKKPRILVFASGSATGGGSGFAKMVEQSRGDDPVLDATIVGVVTNHESGGVRKKAEALGIAFVTMSDDIAFTAERYQWLVQHFAADYVVFSDWPKEISGLEMARTISIHPGPLPLTRGLYGHHVHEAVLTAYHRGEITKSAVTIHFVDGPEAFSAEVQIFPDDTPETLGARVNACGHAWQSRILDLIIHGDIRLVDREVISSVGSLHAPL
ncbi:MAG: hypothetical protein KBB77_01240 [Candidatus Moranbacteria bacterium]|nr:hypothetical protein [Candidatus Moranbacteria bacterium]